jgi:hypothetical protein
MTGDGEEIPGMSLILYPERENIHSKDTSELGWIS